MSGTNTAITISGDAVDIVNTVILDAVKAYLRAQLPFLNLPVVSQLFNFVVDKIAGLIFAQEKLLIAFSIVDLQTDVEVANYQSSLDRLRAAQATGDQNAASLARADVKATLSKLIRWDGT